MDDKTTAKSSPPQGGASAPASQRIRERLTRARERFHANDNIAKYIEPGELPELLGRGGGEDAHGA